MEHVLLTAAIGGLTWHSKRKGPVQGEMCNTGVCEEPTTMSAAPKEQPILFDPPVYTVLRDDRYSVSGCDSDAIHRIRFQVQRALQEDAIETAIVSSPSPE